MATRTLIVTMFLTVELQTIFRVQYVYIQDLYPYHILPVPCNGLLFTSIKHRSKENILMTTILLHYIVQKY